MDSLAGAFSRRASRQINRALGAVIDGSWANRHRDGLDLSGLPTVTGAIWLRQATFDPEAQGTASLDQTRSRGAYRSRRAETVELGNEPPLSVDGGNSGFVDRRRVSVQWFAGTILTALCGAALMGGAVFTSLDGETNFASLPERVEVALRGALGVGADRLGAIAQERPAADRGRAVLRPPGDPRLHHDAGRQS